MIYGSLFSGAGLLDHGLHEIVPALSCAWAVEIDADRRAMFGAHFPGADLHGDICGLSAACLRPVCGLVGGVPCNTHSTSNTAGAKGLAPQWHHAKRLIGDLAPRWTLWESSEKDQSRRHWVPPVRRDLHECGHASVCFRVHTSGRGASHERQRAFVLSWAAATDPDRNRQRASAVHAEVARLRTAPADLWDGRIPACAHGRLADGIDQRVARAVGLGVDQRSAHDAGRVLLALLETL
jgi:site-specific DNA-cytosine methylase